jgi:hypothetical protein
MNEKKMKRKDLIKLIDEAYLSNQAREKIINKCLSNEWTIWKELLKNKEIENKKIHSETTGQNLAFTYFLNLFEKTDQGNFSDLFYVQKSFLGPFVTFYVKSRVYRNIEADKMMMYNDHLVCEPMGKFKPYFDANWSFLENQFSDLIYIPFWLLKKVPQNSTNYKIRMNCNIYELLFGYGGNILRHNILGDTGFKMGH